MTKKNVAVAMSGGVDSSVAAALLYKENFNVVGLTMHLWDYDGVGGNVQSDTSCCSLDAVYDARAVCEKIGIPHYVVDVREEFRNEIINNFISEYLHGRTPNPCILCNSIMKWTVLYNKAAQLGMDYLATGHYAIVEYDPGIDRYLLKKGADPAKDQSYALWALTQEKLRITKLPLGKLSKPEVREIAAEIGLKTTEKRESQDICFIPDNDYNRFLIEQEPELNEKVRGGEIVDTRGNTLGIHKGYPFYTIGQRRGLGIAIGKPMYVVDIDAKRNRIVVGEKYDLQSSGLLAEQANWISGVPSNKGINVEAKIRYNDPGTAATIYATNETGIRVVFHEKAEAVTPGQSVVFYQDDVVVGGGIITKNLKNSDADSRH
ncbi:tRNA 2-thiouridine(34) synthase MnmA [candidate division KSB1 bacterium]|nr:tRNA 2-thiouridine(34) synthase MnmA [candidate division KSB1 bacterium]